MPIESYEENSFWTDRLEYLSKSMEPTQVSILRTGSKLYIQIFNRGATNALAYLSGATARKMKKFDDIDITGLNYKTFYGHNKLRTLVS